MSKTLHTRALWVCKYFAKVWAYVIYRALSGVFCVSVGARCPGYRGFNVKNFTYPDALSKTLHTRALYIIWSF